ncbi:Rv3654c family TadE-like protein [Schaalia suimastitidis]|uniref:Rv3654c family TadE-like protein n=1 Tax=Schaalia suimastitidis TaxID=121163 RepID=UPI0013F46938|nr:Rv3654c family TadE-like protein [Schaalia suimastitidis]
MTAPLLSMRWINTTATCLSKHNFRLRACRCADQRERGSGTVATVGVLVVAIVLLGALLVVSALHYAQARVNAIADLSALAGADISAVADMSAVAQQPCDRAQQVASANGAELIRCEVAGTDIRLELRQRVALSTVTHLGIAPYVSGKARAGPQEGE